MAEQKRTALVERVEQLRDQVNAIQKELRTISGGVQSLHVVLPELHDKSNGRIDAGKMAEFMGVPLKRFVEGLQLNYKTVHKNPSTESIQPTLQPIKRILEILHDFFQKPETIRVWLNTPHPDLDGRTSLDTILSNQVKAVLIILENAAAGVPV